MSYEPIQSPREYDPVYLYDELQRIGTAMTAPIGLQFTVLYAEPARPLEGMLVFADGTSWNPTGAGGGLHQYISGAWDKL